MTPVQCLQKQLDVWESALAHSHKSFRIGTLSTSEHKKHINNLVPKIDAYKQAIEVLRKNNIS